MTTILLYGWFALFGSILWAAAIVMYVLPVLIGLWFLRRIFTCA